MPVVGIIRSDFQLQDSASVIAEATLFGQVDGYSLAMLVEVLGCRDIEGPTASEIASNTFRQIILQHIVNYYVWPRSRLSLVRGTLIHRGFETVTYPAKMKVIREQRYPASLPRHKNIVISGQIDAYFPDAHRLEDYKTCQKIPNYITQNHLEQLAIYTWLLRWSGKKVDSIAINYIAWDDMAQVRHVKLDDGSVVDAILHPLVQDEEKIEDYIMDAYITLDSGFVDHYIPSMATCTLAYCRYCPVKWACDRIAPEGEFIEPEEFRQEDI